MSEDEDFVRFHFEEMPPDERAAFRRRLDRDAALAQRYAEFCSCIAGEEKPQAPRGLADRTTSALEAVGWRGRNASRLVDWTVGSAAVLLVALAVIPATLASREAARRAACADNLRQMSQALAAYSHDHRGYYPRVDPYGSPGLFAVSLADGGYLTRSQMRATLVCPSSMLADEIAKRRVEVVVPTIEELCTAPAVLTGPLLRVMGGSYAYRLGYLGVDGRYVPTQNRGDCRSALLSDAPPPGSVVGHNHGGCSQNVLFQDGSVRFCRGCWSPGGEDHLFLNARGRIAAGLSPRDVVLAPSWATDDAAGTLYRVGPNQ